MHGVERDRLEARDRSRGWGRRRAVTSLAMAALVLVGAQVAAPRSNAVFTATASGSGTANAGRIFRGHRVTPAFAVADSSTGATVDRSSPISYQGDTRWAVMHAWPTAFDAARLVDVTLNHPLPAALAVSGAQLAVTLASDTAGATACWYAEIVRVSTGAVVSTHGSAGSPVACVTGTTFVRTVVPLAAITTTDVANDLLVRIHGRSSTGAAVRLDEVTIAGATPYATFVLYPVRTRDVHAGGVEVLPWLLAAE